MQTRRPDELQGIFVKKIIPEQYVPYQRTLLALPIFHQACLINSIIYIKSTGPVA